MKRLLILTALGVSALFSANAVAQQGMNPLSYGALAQDLSYFGINGGANAGIMPSVALDNGMFSYIDNPASMALINRNYVTLGTFSNFNNRSNTYLSNTVTSDLQQNRLGNIGVVYNVPVDRGSLVIGGGYVLREHANRTNTGRGFNAQSTITDVFKEPGSSYNDIAFNAYAIDYGDVAQTYDESIFRVGFAPGDYPGIQQDVELTSRGLIGEYSVFIATEYKKNLLVGVSIGLDYGVINMDRNVLETDEDNLYDGDFIGADELGLGGTDVQSILLVDDIRSEVLGASLSAGLLYKVNPFLNLGASIDLPTQLNVTESYFSDIETRLDDGRTPYGDNFEGDFEYQIRRPAQYRFGVALDNFNGFSATASAELIDFRNVGLDLVSRTQGDIPFEETRELRLQQEGFDRMFDANYRTVVNWRAGLSYQLMNGTEFRAGGAFLPATANRFNADRILLNGGFGIPLSQQLYLDVGLQYQMWDDVTALYEYFDPVDQVFRSQQFSEDITNLNLLVGIKYQF